MNALFAACQADSPEIVQMLFEKGANVYSIDSEKRYVFELSKPDAKYSVLSTKNQTILLFLATASPKELVLQLPKTRMSSERFWMLCFVRATLHMIS